MNTCPYCGREVSTFKARFCNHNVENVPRNGTPCPLSGQKVPIEGVSNQDHADRAELITDLACQVQDMDPAVVWTYLTCLGGAELQRLLMFTLAAVDVDKSIDELWGWVKALPTARIGVAV